MTFKQVYNDRTTRLVCMTMEVIMILLFFLCSSFCSFAEIFDSKHNATVAEPLDFIFHDHALKSQLFQRQRHETGTLYEFKLPASLSGMDVSYVRLRSKTLWRKGANFSGFQIPSRTLPMPYVKRVVIMYQDLGNLSYQLYNQTIPGYSLVSSVVGLRVYDASSSIIGNVRKLDFNTSDAPILVHFPNLKFPRGAKCASFGVSNGKIFLGEMSGGNVCHTRSYGWFSVVIPKRKKVGVSVWWGVGFVAVLLGSFVGMVLVKIIKVKRLDEMEMQMEEESVDLETVWIGYSKMPCATVTRTHPNLENADLAT